MEKLWGPPSGELIKSACNIAGKLYVFTEKGCYGIEWPPKKKSEWRENWDSFVYGFLHPWE